MARSARPASKHELVLLEPYKQKPHPTGCGFFAVHRHLPGRVDLRVDHGRFGTHMNIKESPRADNPVRLSRIGSGRHGGRPSQEQKANPSLIDDEAFFSTSSMTSLGLCELCETLMLS